MLRVLSLISLAFFPFVALANSALVEGESHLSFPLVFFFLVIMLLFARIGAMVEKIGQPAVLGELLFGVVLGILALFPGLGIIENFKVNEFIRDIAEIGVILLLFRTGLESNIGEMKKVGARALVVALVGVVLPFIGGYFVSKFLLPGYDFNVYLFIGATLTATSVGITARVFKDLGVLKTDEAKIVLGAAVIDDVLGLLILAIVSGIVSSGTVSLATVGMLTLKAFLFLAGAIVIGQLLAPRLSQIFSKVHNGFGMKMAIALLFCGAFAYGAEALAGLAPIVGAFAAGLILDPVHFKPFAMPHISSKIRRWIKESGMNDDSKIVEEMHAVANDEEHGHVENYIDQISSFFVPIFFVYTGMQVNLQVFSDPKIVGIALAISAVAFVGKVLCGYSIGGKLNKKLIGFGMVPRGEVGLIFANVGKQIGVVDDQVFAIVVIVVILTTLLTPPILSEIIKRDKK
ncbi:MAG: cation:proton antiporter [Candidatus Moranbacteria bacterium CG10_big_fil_rev_8_21_14_0_10_35_21]|nr:MAG: cation:proton antiporter [Candidatus Moranbacteria bacterium CG10_big_fil_rev_8_21_14_0_10_35_21]PJA88423.1 MAG: cation:proton antiporter [Candidatus Moranbacteria bacterium CG_4_9_14_3_um_filter_36_9]